MHYLEFKTCNIFGWRLATNIGFWRHGFLFFKSKKSRRWSDLNSGVLEIFCGFTAPGTCLYCVLTNQKGYYKLLGYLSIPHFLFIFLLTRFSDNQKASNIFIPASIVQLKSSLFESMKNKYSISTLFLNKP